MVMSDKSTVKYPKSGTVKLITVSDNKMIVTRLDFYRGRVSVHSSDWVERSLEA